MLKDQADQLYNIGGIKAQLELGTLWSIERINKVLNERLSNSANDKISHLVQYFIGTPSVFESNLPILPFGLLRVRFESFDCITFIYTLLALCRASNFDEFVRNLWFIRYKTDDSTDIRIDNDPDHGNIFDFACESLLENAVKKGFLRNITREVAGLVPLEKINVEIKRFQRPVEYDENVQYVSPKLGERIVSGYFIQTSKLNEIKREEVLSGDLVLFSRGETTRDGKKQPVLISHLAIAMKEGNDIFFVHSTRHFSWRPLATMATSGDYTGIFYDEERKKEQIGVGYAGEFAGDEHTIRIDKTTYCGMNQSKKRTLEDYARSNFFGVMFMRPLL